VWFFLRRNKSVHVFFNIYCHWWSNY
jgi:hypothetical protein